MPYSKACRNAKYPDYEKQGAYVDYKASKNFLHTMKGGIGGETDGLYESLISQKKRVYEWTLQKVEELRDVARNLELCSIELQHPSQWSLEGPLPSDELFTTAQGLNNSPTDELNKGNPQRSTRILVSPSKLKLAAESLLHELLRVHEARNLNSDTLDHIVMRQFRYTALSPSGKWLKIHEKYDFQNISIDEHFYLLSNIFDRIHQHHEGSESPQKRTLPSGAVGSQVFDRRSVKYFVHAQDLPFIYARIVPHLPLNTMTNTFEECKAHKREYRMGQQISSVYMDNMNFLFYHRRLERLEGSTLIRLRWYTENLEEDRDRVAPDSDVFIEMKVHHEAWSGDRSTKRRFAIKERHVNDYFRGTFSLEPAIAKLKAKKTPEREIKKFTSLATEVLGKTIAYGMKPVLKTQCRRAAFQRGSDQTARVSIDTELSMCAEDFGLSRHWRYCGTEPLGTVAVPYAVVEVKLQYAENEKMPSWIEELMSCRFMEYVPKFSKYAHGIAALYGHTRHVHMMPYWLHQVGTDIRAAFKPEMWDPTVGLAVGCMERLADRIVFGTGKAQTQSVGASEAKFLPRSDYGKIYQQLLNRSTIASEATTYSLELRHDSYTHYLHLPTAEVEAVCLSSSAEDRGAVRRYAGGTIPWQVGKRIKVPQKFDPKTFLTSERYLLKWLERSTLVGLAGIATIHFGYSADLPTRGRVPYINLLLTSQFQIYVGLCLVILSLATSLYALAAFHARARRVFARRKIRYDDVSGPSFLTVLLAVAILTMALHWAMLRYGPMLSGSDEF